MPRVLPTLQRRGHALASSAEQLEVLGSVPLPRSFAAAVAAAQPEGLRAERPTILQLNLGKRCNQTCRHCHVDAGPERKEVMSDAVLEAALSLLGRGGFQVLDITGGAPELHPEFRAIVARAAALGRHVIDRCNLTITQLPNYRWIAPFLAEHRVEVTASLPYFQSRQTDAQRGEGVFEESVAALRELNALGYGRPGTGLVLNLVTNPVGAFLPPDQQAAERDWKRELERRHGIVFDRLFTVTNMPISRFLEHLETKGQTEAYLARLARGFNPAAAAGVMCRTTLSVAWDGSLYDCDFNQMLELPLGEGLARDIREFDPARLERRPIALGPHCFGCTAGAGSSCGGAVA